MFTDPVFLVTALLAVLLVGLAKGGFSGIGMAATPLLALAVPPLQALAILLPILIVQDVVSLWWYRRDYDGWNLKVMLPGAVIGVGAAWAVGSVVSDDVVRLIIGMIGVAFVLNVWFGKLPPPGRPSAASGVFWGAGLGLHLDDRVGRHAAVLGPRAAAADGQAASWSAPSRCSSRP